MDSNKLLLTRGDVVVGAQNFKLFWFLDDSFLVTQQSSKIDTVYASFSIDVQNSTDWTKYELCLMNMGLLSY